MTTPAEKKQLYPTRMSLITIIIYKTPRKIKYRIFDVFYPFPLHAITTGNVCGFDDVHCIQPKNKKNDRIEHLKTRYQTRYFLRHFSPPSFYQSLNSNDSELFDFSPRLHLEKSIF